MNHRVVVNAAIALFAIVSPVAASSDVASNSYLATYEVDQAGADSQELSETLTLDRGTSDDIRLASENGTVLTSPMKLGPDGEIEGTSTDPSVTCYNMAASTLFNSTQTPQQESDVFVRVGSGVLKIPLVVTQDRARDGAAMFSGVGRQTIGLQSGAQVVPALITVEARMRVSGDRLTDATFTQSTAIGSATNVVNRQSCSLRTPEPAGTVVSS